MGAGNSVHQQGQHTRVGDTTPRSSAPSKKSAAVVAPDPDVQAPALGPGINIANSLPVRSSIDTTHASVPAPVGAHAQPQTQTIAVTPVTENHEAWVSKAETLVAGDGLGSGRGASIRSRRRAAAMATSVAHATNVGTSFARSRPQSAQSGTESYKGNLAVWTTPQLPTKTLQMPTTPVSAVHSGFDEASLVGSRTTLGDFTSKPPVPFSPARVFEVRATFSGLLERFNVPISVRHYFQEQFEQSRIPLRLLPFLTAEELIEIFPPDNALSSRNNPTTSCYGCKGTNKSKQSATKSHRRKDITSTSPQERTFGGSAACSPQVEDGGMGRAVKELQPEIESTFKLSGGSAEIQSPVARSFWPSEQASRERSGSLRGETERAVYRKARGQLLARLIAMTIPALHATNLAHHYETVKDGDLQILGSAIPHTSNQLDNASASTGRGSLDLDPTTNARLLAGRGNAYAWVTDDTVVRAGIVPPLTCSDGHFSAVPLSPIYPKGFAVDLIEESIQAGALSKQTLLAAIRELALPRGQPKAELATSSPSKHIMWASRPRSDVLGHVRCDLAYLGFPLVPARAIIPSRRCDCSCHLSQADTSATSDHSDQKSPHEANGCGPKLSLTSELFMDTHTPQQVSQDAHKQMSPAAAPQYLMKTSSFKSSPHSSASRDSTIHMYNDSRASLVVGFPGGFLPFELPYISAQEVHAITSDIMVALSQADRDGDMTDSDGKLSSRDLLQIALQRLNQAFVTQQYLQSLGLVETRWIEFAFERAAAGRTIVFSTPFSPRSNRLTTPCTSLLGYWGLSGCMSDKSTPKGLFNAASDSQYSMDSEQQLTVTTFDIPSTLEVIPSTLEAIQSVESSKIDTALPSGSQALCSPAQCRTPAPLFDSNDMAASGRQSSITPEDAKAQSMQSSPIGTGRKQGACEYILRLTECNTCGCTRLLSIDGLGLPWWDPQSCMLASVLQPRVGPTVQETLMPYFPVSPLSVFYQPRATQTSKLLREYMEKIKGILHRQITAVTGESQTASGGMLDSVAALAAATALTELTNPASDPSIQPDEVAFAASVGIGVGVGVGPGVPPTALDLELSVQESSRNRFLPTHRSMRQGRASASFGTDEAKKSTLIHAALSAQPPSSSHSQYHRRTLTLPSASTSNYVKFSCPDHPRVQVRGPPASLLICSICSKGLKSESTGSQRSPSEQLEQLAITGAPRSTRVPSRTTCAYRDASGRYCLDFSDPNLNLAVLAENASRAVSDQTARESDLATFLVQLGEPAIFGCGRRRRDGAVVASNYLGIPWVAPDPHSSLYTKLPAGIGFCDDGTMCRYQLAAENTLALVDDEFEKRTGHPCARTMAHFRNTNMKIFAQKLSVNAGNPEGDKRQANDQASQVASLQQGQPLPSSASVASNFPLDLSNLNASSLSDDFGTPRSKSDLLARLTGPHAQPKPIRARLSALTPGATSTEAGSPNLGSSAPSDGTSTSGSTTAHDLGTEESNSHVGLERYERAYDGIKLRYRLELSQLRELYLERRASFQQAIRTITMGTTAKDATPACDDHSCNDSDIDPSTKELALITTHEEWEAFLRDYGDLRSDLEDIYPLMVLRGESNDATRNAISNLAARSVDVRAVFGCDAFSEPAFSALAKAHDSLFIRATRLSTRYISPWGLALGQTAGSLAEMLSSFEFNVWDLPIAEHPTLLIELCIFMLHDLDLIHKFQVHEPTLVDFLVEIANGYRRNPYHNWIHGFCTMQYTYVMTKQNPQVMQHIPDVELFALLIAAVCHDVDHPGVTNAFEVNSNSELAFLHNDVSVLENHHSVVTFSLLRRPEYDVLASFTPQQARVVRNVIVSSILATDMAQHFVLLEKFNKVVSNVVNSARSVVAATTAASAVIAYASDAGGSTNPSSRPSSAKQQPNVPAEVYLEALNTAVSTVFQNAQNRLLMEQILVHSADLSGQALPTHAAAEWAHRLSIEFVGQVQKERELGLPIADFMKEMHDFRKFAASQLNFVTYVVRPLWDDLCEILPSLKPSLVYIEANRQYWENMSRVDDCDRNNHSTDAGKGPVSATKQI